METKIELEVVTNQLQAALNELKRKRLDRNLIHDYITEALSNVKKINEPAVSKCDGIERESSCNHSDWIDLYYDSGDWYGRYCKDCGEFFE